MSDAARSTAPAYEPVPAYVDAAGQSQSQSPHPDHPHHHNISDGINDGINDGNGDGMTPTATREPLLRNDGGNASDTDDDSDTDLEDLDGSALPSTASTSSSALPRAHSSTTTNAPPTSSPPRTTTVRDGVFSNLAAKPEAPAKTNSDDALPAYNTVVNDSAPPYPVVVTLDALGMRTGAPSLAHDHSGNTDDELLVQGLPVGSPFAFFGAMLVTFVFQLVGFFAAYMVSATFAGRAGARAGLGLVLISFGLNLRGHSLRYEYNPESNTYDERSANAEEEALSLWLCYVLMIVGWFVTIQATGDFVRVKRMDRMLRGVVAGVTGATTTTTTAFTSNV